MQHSCCTSAVVGIFFSKYYQVFSIHFTVGLMDGWMDEKETLLFNKFLVELAIAMWSLALSIMKLWLYSLCFVGLSTYYVFVQAQQFQ